MRGWIIGLLALIMVGWIVAPAPVVAQQSNSWCRLYSGTNLNSWTAYPRSAGSVWGTWDSNGQVWRAVPSNNPNYRAIVLTINHSSTTVTEVRTTVQTLPVRNIMYWGGNNWYTNESGGAYWQGNPRSINYSVTISSVQSTTMVFYTNNPEMTGDIPPISSITLSGTGTAPSSGISCPTGGGGGTPTPSPTPPPTETPIPFAWCEEWDFQGGNARGWKDYRSPASATLGAGGWQANRYTNENGVEQNSESVNIITPKFRTPVSFNYLEIEAITPGAGSVFVKNGFTTSHNGPEDPPFNTFNAGGHIPGTTDGWTSGPPLNTWGVFSANTGGQAVWWLAVRVESDSGAYPGDNEVGIRRVKMCSYAGENPFEGGPGEGLTKPLAEEDTHPQWGMFDGQYVMDADPDTTSTRPEEVYAYSNDQNAQVAAVAAGEVIELTPYTTQHCPRVTLSLAACWAVIPQVITQETFFLAFGMEMVNVYRLKIQDANNPDITYTYLLTSPTVKVGDEVVPGCVIGKVVQLRRLLSSMLESVSLALGGALSSDLDFSLNATATGTLSLESTQENAGYVTVTMTLAAESERLYPSLTQNPTLERCRESTTSACANDDSDLLDLATWNPAGAYIAEDGGVALEAAGMMVQNQIRIDPAKQYTLTIQAKYLGEPNSVPYYVLLVQLGSLTHTFEVTQDYELHTWTVNGSAIADVANMTAIWVFNDPSRQADGEASIYVDYVQIRHICLGEMTVNLTPGSCYFANHEFDADGAGWVPGSGVTFANGQAFVPNGGTLEQAYTLLPNEDGSSHTYTVSSQVRLLASASYAAQVNKSASLLWRSSQSGQYSTLGTVDSALVTTRGLNAYDGTVNLDYPYLFESQLTINAETSNLMSFQVTVNDPEGFIQGLRVDWFCIEAATEDGDFPGQGGGDNDGWVPPADPRDCAAIPPPIENSVGPWTWYHWQNLNRFFKCDLMKTLNPWYRAFRELDRTARLWMRWIIANTQYAADWMYSVVGWMNGHFRNMAAGNVTLINQQSGAGLWDVLLALVNGTFTPIVDAINRLLNTILPLIAGAGGIFLNTINGLIVLFLALLTELFNWLNMARGLFVALVSAYNTAIPLPIDGMPTCDINPQASGWCIAIWLMDNTVLAGNRGAILITVVIGILSVHLVLWMISEVKKLVIQVGTQS
jgi:hypothetical protein